MEKCLCGCKQINDKHGFLPGHHRNPYKGKHLSQKHKNKLSIAGSNRRLTKIHKNNISKSIKEFWSDTDNKEYMKKSMQGRIFSEEHCRSISENHADFSKENHPMWNKHHTLESCNKISATRIKRKVGKLENNSNWRGGLSFIHYCHEFNDYLKEKIRIRDGYQCQNPECLCTQLESYIIYNCSLHVHHVNYDKQNSNPKLITLCNKCNAKANFNKNYWEELYMDILLKRNLINQKEK